LQFEYSIYIHYEVVRNVQTAGGEMMRESKTVDTENDRSDFSVHVRRQNNKRENSVKK